jgi:hypothetical protein
MRTTTLAFVMFAATVTAGCGQKKIAECDALAGVINANVTKLEKAPKNESDPTGIANVKAMAEEMDKVATTTAAVELTIPELKKVRDDYQRMAREIAKAERALALAAEERNASVNDAAKRAAAEAAVKKADSALEAAVKAEEPLVDSLNKYCQAR